MLKSDPINVIKICTDAVGILLNRRREYAI